MPKEQDVRVDTKVPITIAVKGKTPDGTKCQVVFHVEGEGGVREDIETLEEEIKENKISFAWTAKGKKDGGMRDEDLCRTVHCEIQLEGKKPGAASDYLPFRVWAAEFTVRILNVEDGDKLFTNAHFQLKSSSGRKTLRFGANNASDDGMEIALADFSEPELIIFHPFEIVGGWTKKPGRIFEAKAKKKAFKAIFLDSPGAMTEEGKYTRKQYVNIELATRYNDGHRIKIKVGPDTQVTDDPYVYAEVTFSGANGGERSKRTDPAPELIGADANDNNTTYRKKIHLSGKSVEFEIELGLAGGDICTVKIGATEKCEDGSLEITNWRKLGFNLFLPDISISDFGKLGDAEDGTLSEQQSKDIQTELDKAFIEYTCVKTHRYDASLSPELSHFCVDGKLIGRTAGSKAIWADDGNLKDFFAAKLKAQLPGELNKPYYHTAIVVDRILESDTGGKITATLTSTSQEIKLHGAEFYTFAAIRKRRPYTGIQRLNLRLTKLNGKALTDEQISDHQHPLHYWMRVPSGRDVAKDTRALDTQEIISASWDFERCLHAQKKHVEFISNSKIKLNMPSGTGPGDIFQNYTGVEFEVSIDYHRYKDAGAMGMQLPGSDVLAYPSTGCYTGIVQGLSSHSLPNTIIHELFHVMDFAYFQGSINPSKHKIPGVDYRTAVPEGYAYDGHGHSGGHCAYGVGAQIRKAALYDWKLMSILPSCVCWGADVFVFNDLHLCDECALIARAQDLRDLATFA
jgi:hypothetical protein